MSANVATLWRCRRCGKWSMAKRRPASHKPIRPDPEFPDDPSAWRPELCGPFDRYIAVRDDATPPPDLENAGRALGPSDRQRYGNDHDSPIPF